MPKKPEWPDETAKVAKQIADTLSRKDMRHAAHEIAEGADSKPKTPTRQRDKKPKRSAPPREE